MAPRPRRFLVSHPPVVAFVALPRTALVVAALTAARLAGAQPSPGDPPAVPTVAGPAVAGPAVAGPASAPAGPRLYEPVALAPAVVPGVARAAADTGRPRAVAYSDAYGTRLTIHQWASYATYPVLVAEYVLGDRLIRARQQGRPTPQGVKGAHGTVALALGGLFAVNTVTGVWNLWDARHDPNGRARRTVHSVLMLAADAGFAAAGALAENATSSQSGANLHRNVALVSTGVTLAAGAMMYLWKE